MKVGFLRAYDPKVPYQWSLPPLGIGYLAAYAKRETRGHEFFFEQMFEDILAQKPDLLAISSATENFTQAANFARIAKEELGIPVIIGGMQTTALPQTLPPVFDAGAMGEGEATFVELLELYDATRKPDPSDFAKIKGLCYHDNGKVAINPARELMSKMDVLPYPDRELLGDNWAVPFSRQLHFMSSRGCPYKCSFCSSSSEMPWNEYRFFSAEYTVGEIERMLEKHDSEVFYFFDDLFIAHSRRFKRICKLLKERRLLDGGLKFRCYGRVDLIKEPMADLLAEHNFHLLDFGFESNDEQTLKTLNKTYASPEINQRAVDLLAERGISVGGNFIIGNPGEDHAAVQLTVDFIEKNEAHLDRLGFGILQPLPGTRMWELALKRGIVSEDMDWSVFAFTQNGFDHERFPSMADKMTMAEVLGWLDKVKTLTTRVNMAGQIRTLQNRLDRRETELAQLNGRLRDSESKLASYEGSRLVRAALKARDLRGRLAPDGSNGDRPAEPADSPESAPPGRNKPPEVEVPVEFH